MRQNLYYMLQING